MDRRKMKRRDFLKLSAATSSSLFLAACGAAPQTTPGSSEIETSATDQATIVATEAPIATVPAEAAVTNVTLRWWDFPRSWAPPGSQEKPNAWNEEMAKTYMAENPGVTVEVTGVGWSDGPQKLDVALAAGETPDIMYGYPALFGKMLSLNVLEPIDDAIALMDQASVDDFYKPALDFVTVNGKKMAWPWYYSSEGEWAINTTIVKEAGAEDLLPKAPDYAWTPDQMLALAKKCTFKRDADQVWGLSLYANDQQGINLWPLWSFPYMFGAKLYDEQARTSDFGSDAGVRSLQFMHELVEKHKVSPPGTAGLTSENTGELWNRQQLAIMMSGGVEQVQAIKKGIEAGSIQGPFEVLPVQPPTSKGIPVRTNGGIGVQMVFKQTDASKRAAAMKFAEWLVNAENIKVLGNLTPVTARQSATEELAANDEVTKWRIKYILPTMASYSKAPEDLKITDLWMQALQAMFTNDKSPEQAAMWFQDETTKLLKGA